jgi:hypothetical protein
MPAVYTDSSIGQFRPLSPTPEQSPLGSAPNSRSANALYSWERDPDSITQSCRCSQSAAAVSLCHNHGLRIRDNVAAVIIWQSVDRTSYPYALLCPPTAESQNELIRHLIRRSSEEGITLGLKQPSQEQAL